MTGNLTTRELAGIAIGQTSSNSVAKGQRGYDERYLDGIHDLVSEEEERQRPGGSLQVNAAGMLQELDGINSLQSSLNKSSSSGTPNTSNQGDHECGRHNRRGFLNSEQVDHQASNRPYMPSECTVSRTEMTSIQHWYSESPNRMPWCPIPLRGDPSAHRPQFFYRGSGESGGTVQMRAETWAYQEENEQDIHAKWSTEGTYGFSER